MKHCCQNMSHYAGLGFDIQYDEALRYYSMPLRKGTNGTHQMLLYCPWCGTKLPKDLDGKWSEILLKEYGIKDPNFDDADKVPAEFKTDEWWKKRGL